MTVWLHRATMIVMEQRDAYLRLCATAHDELVQAMAVIRAALDAGIIDEQGAAEQRRAVARHNARLLAELTAQYAKLYEETERQAPATNRESPPGAVSAIRPQGAR